MGGYRRRSAAGALVLALTGGCAPLMRDAPPEAPPSQAAPGDHPDQAQDTTLEQQAAPPAADRTAGGSEAPHAVAYPLEGHVEWLTEVEVPLDDVGNVVRIDAGAKPGATVQAGAESAVDRDRTVSWESGTQVRRAEGSEHGVETQGEPTAEGEDAPKGHTEALGEAVQDPGIAGAKEAGPALHPDQLGERIIRAETGDGLSGDCDLDGERIRMLRKGEELGDVIRRWINDEGWELHVETQRRWMIAVQWYRQRRPLGQALEEVTEAFRDAKAAPMLTAYQRTCTMVLTDNVEREG